MPRHTLYAYVNGSDLWADEPRLLELLSPFVVEGGWRFSEPCVVNQRETVDPQDSPEDLPKWDLGLNMDLPDPGHEPSGWFGDVERIAVFLSTVAKQTGRDFVLGIADNGTGIAEDLFEITSALPDLGELKRIVGVPDEAA